MTQSVLKTADGEIEVEHHGASVVRATAKIVAVACGNFSALQKVSYPVDQMQLRGYGKSVVTSPGRFQLRDYVADIAAVSATSASSDVLFGYSHGGYFVAMRALANPSSVKALILVEPALYTSRDDLLDRAEKIDQGNQDQAIERTLRFIEPTVGLVPQAASRWVKEIAANVNDPRTIADEFRIRAENPITDEDLARIDVPTLLIGGTASQMAFMVRRAAQAIPHASVAWVRGASHLGLQDDAHAVQTAGMIDAFLRSLH